jgi:8-oxo-dGTP pyrophosphatase MutT (NUDIX family)
MNNQIKVWSHIGVYGIYIRNNEVLLIKKSRGPYKGMFDLPGGKIEEGESLEQALRREFNEEVDCEIDNLEYLGVNDYSCEYKKDENTVLNFQHHGTYYIVSLLSDDIKIEPDGEDSLGAEFVNLKGLNNIMVSPIAKPMILKVASI